ncbi:MAG TPA: hypothetical protein VMN81_14370 [Vicinamibacterales bacterium]|nr:hypothetical protein [Vicinamibacterales bacterium]
MNIDRIAGAMTGGRPRADFTARVMAPIYGRPRPGFTSRVMNGLDAPAAGRGFSPGFRPALLLVPAAIVLIAGVMAVRASRVDLPAPPVAPSLATAPVFNPAMEAPPQAPRVAQAFRPATRQAQTPAPAEQAPPEPPPIYMIAALEGPDDIAMKSIEPAAFTIPALDGPAPLKVADLKNSKEKP